MTHADDLWTEGGLALVGWRGRRRSPAFQEEVFEEQVKASIDGAVSEPHTRRRMG